MSKATIFDVQIAFGRQKSDVKKLNILRVVPMTTLLDQTDVLFLNIISNKCDCLARSTTNALGWAGWGRVGLGWVGLGRVAPPPLGEAGGSTVGLGVGVGLG